MCVHSRPCLVLGLLLPPYLSVHEIVREFTKNRKHNVDCRHRSPPFVRDDDIEGVPHDFSRWVIGRSH